MSTQSIWMKSRDTSIKVSTWLFLVWATAGLFSGLVIAPPVGAAGAVAGRCANQGQPIFRGRDETWESTAWRGSLVYGAFVAPVTGFIGMVLAPLANREWGIDRPSDESA